jgi:polyphosphate:AMP phosphotransferase
MFESAKLPRKLSRREFDERVPGVRERLLNAQDQLAERKNAAVALLVVGPGGAGKGELVNRLLDWLDARGVHVHALRAPTTEESERPELYRYWRRLPRRGKINIFSTTWYSELIGAAGRGELSDEAFERSLRRIGEFESMLSAEGVRLVKIGLYITKKEQKKRFDKLESDPETAFRVSREDWEEHREFEALERASAVALRRTDTVAAPWYVIAAKNKRYRDLTAGEILLDVLERAASEPEPPPVGAEPVPPPVQPNIIDNIDLSLVADEKTYDGELDALQNRFGRKARKLLRAERSVVAVFEGPDAAGKGGAIRRVVHALDARFYQVVPIAAPTDEEAALPYLWRFWRHLPEYGHFTIFDRSWYGRVLVERVEGFAPPDMWKRAYEEINSFEEQLVDKGIIVLKFWIAISKDEQMKRFSAREATGYKRYKLTAEDYRNREKWPAYVTAACDMVERTSTELAPWTLVSGEDKRWARLQVLKTFVERLDAAL